jgi:hypothetical protein
MASRSSASIRAIVPAGTSRLPEFTRRNAAAPHSSNAAAGMSRVWSSTR